MDDKIVSRVAPMIDAARPALSEAEIERRRGRPWTLAVVSAGNVSPRMRRVRLTADNLDEFRPRPGQEIVLQIPQTAGEPARRHYTIRHFDPQTRLIDVDFVLHGDTAPGVRWAREARPGQAIDIRGPRGRIALAAGADWHLFSGDETALPAIFALVEALGDGAAAYVFLEVGDAAGRAGPEVARRREPRLSPPQRRGARTEPNSSRCDRALRVAAGARPRHRHRRDRQCPGAAPPSPRARDGQGPNLFRGLLASGTDRRPRSR